MSLQRAPRLEDSVQNQNALDSRQGAIPMASDEVIPTEDPNLKVVMPAGGEVLRGGAGIAGLTLQMGPSASEAAAADTADKLSIESSIKDHLSNVSAAMPAAAAGATMAPIIAPPPTSATMAPVPGATTVVAGMTTVAMSGTTAYGASNTTTKVTTSPNVTTMATTTRATTVVGTTAARTTAMMNGYGGSSSSYGSSPASSYGSSGGSSGSSSYGSSSGSTGSSSGSSSNVNSIGVPYGYYTQVQYFPYAQNASQQLTSPLIFSPYLPVPSYINRYFGLNLPLTSGRR